MWNNNIEERDPSNKVNRKVTKVIRELGLTIAKITDPNRRKTELKHNELKHNRFNRGTSKTSCYRLTWQSRIR